MTGRPAIPFRKVLIANRGEIACRVRAHPAHSFGIGSVAIHHTVEARARHVRDGG